MVDIQVTFLLRPEDVDGRFLRRDGTFACNRLLHLTSQNTLILISYRAQRPTDHSI
jgi:hypothetical protein